MRVVPFEAHNAAWVEERRGGGPTCVAEMPATPLSRHAVDELYSLTLAEALEAGVCVLTGVPTEQLAPVDMYARLAADLTANHCRVIVDLAGPFLEAALSASPAVVKLDADELVGFGRADNSDEGSLIKAVRALHDDGIAIAVVTRGPEPVLAACDQRVWAFTPPGLTPVETRGTGDSMTGALAAALATGAATQEALRSAVAAGALNVTRRGLGSGHADQVAALARRVAVDQVG